MQLDEVEDGQSKSITILPKINFIEIRKHASIDSIIYSGGPDWIKLYLHKNKLLGRWFNQDCLSIILF